MKNSLKKLQKIVIKFRDDRGWRRFHHPKDLSISVAIEAAELMELFQWKDTQGSIGDRKKMEEEFRKIIKNKQFLQRIKEELADVLIYSIFLADVLKIDLEEIIKMKIKMNAKKYPVKKVIKSAKNNKK